MMWHLTCVWRESFDVIVYLWVKYSDAWNVFEMRVPGRYFCSFVVVLMVATLEIFEIDDKVKKSRFYVILLVDWMLQSLPCTRFKHLSTVMSFEAIPILNWWTKNRHFTSFRLWIDAAKQACFMFLCFWQDCKVKSCCFTVFCFSLFYVKVCHSHRICPSIQMSNERNGIENHMPILFYLFRPHNCILQTIMQCLFVWNNFQQL